MHSYLSVLSDLTLYTHVISGSLALLCFWIPVFARKGGINHRRVGNWYVRFMWGVVVTAVLLCVKNIIVANYLSAAFLGFLSLITARPLWNGIAILKNKKELSVSYQRTDLFLLGSIVVASFGMLILGYGLRAQGMGAVILIFGILGLTNLPEFLRNLKPGIERHWLREHFSGLIISGIAAHTAFLVFGAATYIQVLFTSYWATLPWFLPSVIGGLGIAYSNRRYGVNKIAANKNVSDKH